jgi:DNA-binding winged helix-turn-helix (wHTH) protein/TolB-like protein
MDKSTARVRFGDVEAHLATGELYRNGRMMRLQEQPRQVLAALLETPGEVVTRDALRDRLWKSNTFVDFEHGLNTAIKKLRQALGDSADSPRFVETLARRGYRFIAPVEGVVSAHDSPTMAAPSVALPLPPLSVPEQPARRSVSRMALVLLVVGGIGLAVWLAAARGSRERGNSAPAQLAVLPLRVLAPQNEDSAYLGVGIADAITTRLANVRQFALRPTSAVLQYQDAQSDPARAAAALGVQHLLLGTIQQADNAYRVSVQLVRSDGVAVWGRSYDVPTSGLLRLQDTVADQIVTALRVELTGPERARLNVRHTDNPAAYELYLRGRTLLLNYTDANMRQAIQRFEEALALDPDYALARAALAMSCAWFSVRYAYQADAVVWGSRAEAEARRALAQQALLGEAHLAIASAAGTLHRGFDWKTVLDETAIALALDRSLELAHVARMRALYHLGLFEAAREEARLARALNPNPSVEMARLEVAILLFAGDFQRALNHGSALLERTDAPAVRQYVGLARFYRGDITGAREMLASAMRGNQRDVGYVRADASLASIEAAAGLREEARRRIDAIEGGTYMDHHVAYSLGAASAQLGDPTGAMRWLQKAADTGFPCYPWFARDTLLEPLHREPTFQALMSRAEAQHRAVR